MPRKAYCRAGVGRIAILKDPAGAGLGWMTSGFTAHFDGSPTPGVLPEVAANVVLLEPNDSDALRDLLAADDDVAAALIEPTGGSFGMTPLAPGFLAALREQTLAKGVLLVFDEVITGFRVARGGAQEHFGIAPDLTTLAKIVAGGLPGGAVVGRAEVLERLDFAAAAARGVEKIQHPGTFNANPLSAAAGTAALEVIRTTDACARANAAGAMLRERLNEVLDAEDVPWAAYGSFSGLHLFTNPKGRAIRPSEFDPFAVPYPELKTKQGNITHRLRLAMLVEGVDLNNWPGALLSAAHGETELSDTVDAFREALRMLKREGDLDR